MTEITPLAVSSTEHWNCKLTLRYIRDTKGSKDLNDRREKISAMQTAMGPNI